jgi:hypothetical protein
MLLTELYNFGQQVGVPYGFVSNKKLNFLITISSDGDFLDVSPLEKLGQNLLLTASVRGANVAPNFLHDSLDYILGKKGVNVKGKIETKKNEEANMAIRHAEFINLHKNIYELFNNPYLKAINLFYEKNQSEKLNEKLNSLNYDNTSGWFGFRILDGDDYVRPHEDKKLIEFYSNFLLNRTISDNKKGQCSITGKIDQPLVSTSVKKIKGLPNSQPTGSSIYSNNFSSVESFGLKQLNSSRISQEADYKITNALEYLLDNSKHNMKLYDLNKVYVFWTDEPINEQFDPLRFFNSKINVEDVKNFLTDWKANKNKLENVSEANCSLIEIDTSTTRPFFKFFNFKESEIKNNLEKWFKTIECEYGNFRYFSIFNLVESIDNNSSYSKKIKQDLFGMMFFSRKPSNYLKVQINKENFCFAGPFTTNKRKELSHKKMALINACLGYSNMETINYAYNYGKILAFADNLQYKALDNVNVTISQKFYRGSNPKQAFKELDSKIRVYLNMIKKDKKGLGFYFEGKYNEIISQFFNGDTLLLPSKFNDDEQLWKAKGFYDERLNKTSSEEKNIDALVEN